MSWFFLALCSALFQALTDTCSKTFTRQYNIYQLSAILFGSSALILWPAFLFVEIPVLQEGFLSTLLLVCILDVIGVLLYMEAIRSSDLSLVMPLQMFTPLFLLVTAPIMVGEIPTPVGVCGVLLIVTGSYVLNLKTNCSSPLAPFHALINNRGARCMLIGAFLWSLTCNLHKTGLTLSSPIFYLFAHHIGVTVLLAPLALLKGRDSAQLSNTFENTSNAKSVELKTAHSVRKTLAKSIKFRSSGPDKSRCERNTEKLKRPVVMFLLLGIVSTLTGVCQLTALEAGFVVYVTSVKRTSVLVAICLGALIFKELGFRERFAGASIMVTGAILTTL